MTLPQAISIFVAVCAFLSTGSAAAQVTDIVGADIGHLITSLCGLLGGIGAIVLTTLTTERAQIQAVEQRPGVTKIVTNVNAIGKLAELSADPDHPKIGPYDPDRTLR